MLEGPGGLGKREEVVFSRACENADIIRQYESSGGELLTRNHSAARPPVQRFHFLILRPMGRHADQPGYRETDEVRAAVDPPGRGGLIWIQRGSGFGAYNSARTLRCASGKTSKRNFALGTGKLRI